jgi:pyrroline-5-carboxylate reductase
MLSGALAKGIVNAQDVAVGELVEGRRTHLSKQYGVEATPRNLEAIQAAQLVVLAVKPQQLTEVLLELRGNVGEGQTVLSIVAGAGMNNIIQGLRHPSVIRVMPNTPAQVAAGISVWTASPQVPAEVKEFARTLLSALGEELYVSDEKYLDMATALSASGPAYVLVFIESLVDAGVYLGMPRDMATALTLQTVMGSVRLVQETGKHPAELCNMVTSPGGTTAEALLVLETHGFRATVIEAVIAAYKKSLALGSK